MADSAVFKLYKKYNLFFIIVGLILFNIFITFWVANYLVIQSFVRKIRLKHLIDSFVLINVLFGIDMEIIEVLVIYRVLLLDHSIKDLKTRLITF